MSFNTIAEYRNLYTARHGIQCPLTDAQVRTALDNAGVLEDTYPLSPAVLTEMETLVIANFPEVDQGRYQHAGNFQAPQDLALDNETIEGFDVNFSLPTGGNLPYSSQLQIAPDVESAPGEWANEGDPQDDNSEIVVTGLSDNTPYWARLVCTDNLGEVSYSNEVTATTVLDE